MNINKSSAKNFGLFVWGICALFYAFEFFLRSSTNALAPIFQSDYGFSLTATSIIGSSFYWFYVLAQIPAGISVDKFGVKRVMIFATLLTVLGMLIFTFANQPWQFVVARALVGFGGGFAFISSLKAAALWLPTRLFPTFAGLTQLFGYLGGSISGIPLILLLQHFHLHIVLVGILVVTFLIFLSTIFIIRKHPHFDTKRKPHGGHPKMGTMLDSIKAFGRLTSNPQLLLNGFYCLMICGTTAIFADLWGISYFTHVFNYSSETAAYASSLIFIGVALSSPMWGFLATLIDNNKKLLVAASAIGIILLSVLLYVKVSIPMLFVLCFLFGSVQSVHVLNFTIITKQIDKKNLGTGIAFINLFIPLSGAILQPISGMLIQFFGQHSNSTAQAYQYAMILIPVLLVISTILALFLKEKSSHDVEEITH